MNGEKIAKGLGWVLVILLFLIPYLIGSQSGNGWVGVLAFVAILLAWTGTAIYAVQETLAGYLIPALLSLLSLAAAIWLSRMVGGWWWAGAWLMVSLAHYATAIDAWQEEDSHMRIALTLGILSTASAFLSPWLLAPILQGRGISLSPVWGMWLLLLLAFLALGVAWYQGYRESEEKRFIGWSLLGVGLLAGATWLSGLRGGWWWALPWTLAALLIGHAASDLRQYSFGRVAGNLGILLAILCLAVGVGGPYLVGRGWSLPAAPIPGARYRLTPTFLPTEISATPSAQGGQAATPPVRPTPQPSATPEAAVAVPTPTPVAEQPAAQPGLDSAAGRRAVQRFLLAAVRSGWGIFHLFTLFALGYLWLRRGWGGLLLLLLLLFAVGWAGAKHSAAEETLIFIVSSNPADWMREALRWSIERWGSMGWGILLISGLTSVAIVPLIRYSSKVNRVWRLQADMVVGLSTMQKIASGMEAMGIRPLDTLFTGYVTFTVPIGLWIALWVALRQTASLGGLPLGFWDIPDLTVPHWKPVWNLHYYLLGLALWLSLLALQRLQQKYDPLAPAYQGCQSGFVLFIGAFLTASLVPAGVMLFSIALVLSQILLFPVRVIGIPEPKPPKPIPSPAPPKPTPAPAPPQPTPAPTPLAGSLVWKSPAPLVAMMEWGGARWFLREDGDVVRHTTTPQKSTLPITRGQAIYGLKESDNRILVIGNGNRLLWLDAPSLEVVKDATLSQPGDAVVLNPYRTILAWINVSGGTAAAFSLEAGKEFILLSGLNLAPALAFSADGRYLALGSEDGVIHLVDFAMRKVVATLAPPETSQGQAVRSLFGRKDGGWVSVYADRQVVLWSAERQVEKSMKPGRRIMALDFHVETVRLALGLSDGILQVFDAGLNKIFEETVQEKEISHVCFSQNGRSVFTIGDKTEVRRVDL